MSYGLMPYSYVIESGCSRVYVSMFVAKELSP